MNAFLQNFDYPQCFNDMLKSAKEHSFQDYASSHGDDTHVVQLSAGRFGAKVLTTGSGSVLTRLECCNQVIEREMSSGPDALVFHVCVDEHHPDLSYNGITRETDWVFVQPPGAKNVLISPPWSVQLTVQVSYTFFLHHLSSMPEIGQWITRLNRNGDFLKSTLIADRLRDTGRLAIEFSEREIWTDVPDAVAKNLMLGLIIGLTLQWLPNNAFPTYPKPKVLNRFQTMRRLLLENHEVLHDDSPRAISKLGSRRSIEKAFSELIDMGPVMYARVLRLNRARRKFRDPAFSGQTIGDIAAEEGFWEWSRFTSYYRKQFGELPSETRSRSPRFKACA